MHFSGLAIFFWNRETECRDRFDDGRVTWLVCGRTKIKYLCFCASLWVWIFGCHIMMKIQEKGKSCPSLQYNGGWRFYDIYRQNGYWCETTKCGLTLACGKDRWLMEKSRKPWFCCFQPLVQTLFFVVPAFYDFKERPKNLEYSKGVHRA